MIGDERRPAPTVATVLDVVVSKLTEDRSHQTCLRYARARAQLEAHLLVQGERVLTEAGVAMFEVERQLAPEGALLRVATSEDLLYALEGFAGLDRSRLPVSDARAQLRLAEECGRHIRRRELVDLRLHIGALWRAEDALRRARAVLRRR